MPTTEINIPTKSKTNFLLKQKNFKTLYATSQETSKLLSMKLDQEIQNIPELKKDLKMHLKKEKLQRSKENKSPESIQGINSA